LRKIKTNISSISHNIADESEKSYKLPERLKIKDKQIENNPSLAIEVPDYDQ